VTVRPEKPPQLNLWSVVALFCGWGCCDVQREGLKSNQELGFEFRKHRFVYNAESHTFEKLRYPVKVCSPMQHQQSASCKHAKLGSHETQLHTCLVPMQPLCGMLLHGLCTRIEYLMLLVARLDHSIVAIAVVEEVARTTALCEARHRMPEVSCTCSWSETVSNAAA
jgi:hypothetical protein